MADMNNFSQVFPQDGGLPVNFSAPAIKKIKDNRLKLHGLFFDRICNQLGLQNGHNQYPAKDEQSLRTLHGTIARAGLGPQQKAALLFYLLLGLQHGTDTASGFGDEADRFAKNVGLARGYQTAIRGFWEMDRLEFRSALDHLTQPSLLPSLSTEVLEALLKHSKDQGLPLAYYHAVAPPLPLGSEVRKTFYKYLTEISPVQTFYASRSSPDRRELFELMIHSVLSCKPTDDRADMAVLLVDLPFDADESSWWEEYLSGHDGRGLPNAMDVLHMRHIATCKVSKAAESMGIEGRLRGKKIAGVDWDTIREGVAKGSGGRKGLEAF